MNLNPENNGSEIAIIGMEGRFPGAKNIDEFWKNLQNGVESISFFTDEELLSSGTDATTLNNPNFVKAKAVLEDVELFDASFFGFNPREAEILDPQQRLFLECAWSALENAGYDSEKYPGSIGVYAGSSFNNYFLNIYSNQNNIVDVNQIVLGVDKDFLTTRVSYKLNLEGSSMSVQTACSTSLVAVHLACQNLLNGECDMALAGGVSINSSRKAGYFYYQGGVDSPDGHCRAFDAKAQGTVSGEGVGIVVLKRLTDALADGDSIQAVIKGSAINNDGANKVSYTAPRIDSQAKVIRTAQVVAEVEPETITYIEAHGTGTFLGDPIEIAALTQAFNSETDKKGFCAIGSLKTNIGHLDVTAGVAGLIKTVLSLQHQQIPPSLHFEQPNPQIDFVNSPFYVNSELASWQALPSGVAVGIAATPRRAGVSSFGIGGTNAHVILEEAPAVAPSGDSRPWQLLLLSAKTDTALETATANLADYLQQHPELNLADVAYTLQVGRRDFEYRRMLVCQKLDDAVKALSTLEPQRVFTDYQKPCNRPVVFMFSGQGAQYVNMGKELYQSELIFSSQVDYCCEFLKPYLGLDLRQVIFPVAATQQLTQTHLTQPALFVIEYALAKLWMAWGIRPETMIGHSIGEYVAACLADVFSLEDALSLVAIRGRLMQQLPSGAMLSVQLPEQEVRSLLNVDLDLATCNSPFSCVVSGTTENVDALQQKLQAKNISCRRLHTSHAFHSQMMDAIAEPYTQFLQKVKLNSPKIPFISNVTGTWITTAQATNPDYWAKHLRETVRFSEGISQLLFEPERILLEVGPGRTLSTLVKQQTNQQVVLTSLRHPQEQYADVAFLLNTLGRLWLAGVEVKWSSFYARERRYHIPLPTYPFERQRYWIEAPTPATAFEEPLHKKPNIADWFYIPVWKQSIPVEFCQARNLIQPLRWLVFLDTYGVGQEIVKRLEQQQNVITVSAGERFAQISEFKYVINPQQKDDYEALLQALSDRHFTPQAIAHFWSITPNDISSHQTQFEDCQNLGFYSLLFLAQALGKQNITDPVKLIIVTSNIYDVTGEEKLFPQKATVTGPCKVIPQEYPHITCRNIDIVIPAASKPTPQLIDQLVTELIGQQTEDIVAYRRHHRWVQTFEAVRLDEPIPSKTKLRKGGVYLITGGLGGIGLVLAEYLAKTLQAKLILIGRKALPEQKHWENWLATHDHQDSVSRKIQKILALEENGTQIQVNSADVTNLEQMQIVIAQALKQFGQINGVIHAAGIAGGGVIQLKTPDIVTNVLAPKVRGTLVLQEVLKNINLDFFVLCSSHNAILGEFGQVDYCAANAFQDAYVHQNHAFQNSQVISINWDAWQQVGMAVETFLPDKIKHKREENLKQGILPQEGVDAFNRILHSGLVHVVVSTKDFPSVIQQNHSFVFLENELALQEKLVTAHPRPRLQNAYTVPRNQTEQKLADIWQQILGIEVVGIDDNFFDLGGDSLLSIQVISGVRKQFQIELSVNSIFEFSTVATMSEQIENMRSTQKLQNTTVGKREEEVF